MIGKTARIVSGTLVAMAAAIAVWEWATDDTISTADDVVAAVNELKGAVEARDGLSFTETQIRDLETALGAVVQAAATTSGASEESAYLRVYSGSFEVPLGQSADVEFPGGGFGSVGFVADRSISDGRITAAFDGVQELVEPGHWHDYPDQPGCNLLYVGQTDPRGGPAVFRFRCAP